MTVRSKVQDATARRVTIDRVYAGINLSDRCICGDLANDHEAKYSSSSHKFNIRCVNPKCRCTTFIAHVTRAEYLDRHNQLERMNHAAQQPTK